MRKTLTVTEVLPPESWEYQGKTYTKYPFRATDGDDDLKYIIRTKAFTSELVLENTFEAEVEVKEKGNYTDRIVIDILKDGKSTKPEAKRFGKSPEEIAGMRQGNAMTCIAREHTAGRTFKVKIEDAYIKLLEEALDITPQPKTEQPMETPAETAKTPVSATTAPHSLIPDDKPDDYWKFVEKVQELMDELKMTKAGLSKIINDAPYHVKKLVGLSVEGREALYRELTGMVKNNG